MKTGREIEILHHHFSDFPSPIAHLGLELSIGCQFKHRDPIINQNYEISYSQFSDLLILAFLYIKVAAHGWLFWTESIEYCAILVPEYIQMNQEFETSCIHFSDFPFLDCTFVSSPAPGQLFEMRNRLIFLIGICMQLKHPITSEFEVLKIAYYLRFQVFYLPILGHCNAISYINCWGYQFPIIVN
jgi:hypothetical protein